MWLWEGMGLEGRDKVLLEVGGTTFTLLMPWVELGRNWEYNLMGTWGAT